MKYRFDYESIWRSYGTGQTYSEMKYAIMDSIRKVIPEIVSFFDSIPEMSDIGSTVNTGGYAVSAAENSYAIGAISSPKNAKVYLKVGANGSGMQNTLYAGFSYGSAGGPATGGSMAYANFYETRTNGAVTEVRIRFGVVVCIGEKQIYVELFDKNGNFHMRSPTRAVKLTQIINPSLLSVSLDDWFLYSPPGTLGTGGSNLAAATQTYITPDNKIVSSQGLMLIGAYYSFAYSDLRTLPYDLPTAKPTVLIDGVLYDEITYTSTAYRYYLPRILE